MEEKKIEETQEEAKNTEFETVEKEMVDKELEELKEVKKKKEKGKIGRTISNIILTIIVLVVIFEAIIGIINMKRINDGEEPVWYISTEKKEESNKVVTSYNLGLYRIVKTDTDKDTRIVLKLFFLED